MKVLVSAYACEPHCGSEPAIGWNVVRGLSGGHELTVMTRANNAKAILGCGEDWVRAVDWVFLDPPRWLTFWKKGRAGVRLFYLIWQVAAYFKGRELVAAARFDVVHHLTFASVLPASPLAFLGRPFVAGPLGGAEEAPPALVKSLSLRQRVAVHRQRLTRKLVGLISWAGPAYRRSAFCLGATKEAVARLEKLGASRVGLEVQSGLAPQVFEDLSSRTRVGGPGDGPLRVLVASRMVFWKGVDLAIEAVAMARAIGIDVILELSETGPEEEKLRRLASHLGLENSVTFLGRLPGHDEFLEKLATSHVLLHPAFSESFGQVCLEALACGVPVVCLNWGGPGVIVNEECGYPVEVGSRGEIIERLAKALVKCQGDRCRGHHDPAVLHRRAASFTWGNLVEAVSSAYEVAAGDLSRAKASADEN